MKSFNFNFNKNDCKPTVEPKYQTPASFYKPSLTSKKAVK